MKRWHILPAYLVRVAGFSFERLEPLRCRSAAVADEALAAALAARASKGAAFDEAIGGERYASAPALDDPAARKAFGRHVKAARAFARRLSDAPLPADALREIIQVFPRAAACAAELETAHASWLSAARAFETAFAADFEQTRLAIRELYRDERMQEAVFLESPEAFERILQLVAAGGPRNARARQRERLAAMYAQRFCAKNDTNSLCGPHGVGYVSAAAAGAARIEIAREDASRQTYFSHWAAQRLLDESVRRAGDAALVTLRLHPMAILETGAVTWCAMDNDETTFRRRYARSELPESAARVLHALARPRDRSELAALAREVDVELGELTAFIEQVVGAGLVVRGPTVPPGLFHPLRAVATELLRWPPSEARTWALAEVEAIEQLVTAFAQAPLAERRELLARLIARFEASTGSAGTRGDGRHYADRSVLHEDRYIDVRADIGAARAALDSVVPVVVAAVELPLLLARERVREWFRARFPGRARVPAVEVHRAFDDERVLDTPAATPHAGLLRDAIERVRDAIGRAVAAADGGPARLSPHDLRLALAGVPEPTHGGYVSSDVMVHNPASGGVHLVLAEVHGFFWLPTCLIDVVPPEQRERIVGWMRAAMREMARGRPTAESVFLHSQATDRRIPLATTDLILLVPSERSDAIDLSALDLRLAGDEFEFLRGDEEIIPLVAYNRYAFLHYTSRLAPLFDDHSDRFFPEGMLPHTLREGDMPRLCVGDVVFQRRLWRRPAVSVRAALAAGSEAELFRCAQAFRRTLGCEERVFVSVTGEPKPVLLDFHNVFLLEALVNSLDRAPDDAVVKITEMLPGPGELVTHGPDGLRTAELRMGFYRT